MCEQASTLLRVNKPSSEAGPGPCRYVGHHPSGVEGGVVAELGSELARDKHQCVGWFYQPRGVL